ncbi:MAG TPA: recombination protein RecR [Flavobacteriales bacterium]|nr:recombination protein RecR [Flavobacteriales bacterium]|tara:strand:+ start:115271 stop:115894 length:624 start_codon:yes stop_codon:yes gene_type:complete
MNNSSSSKLIEEAVDQMSSLPGIGRKTALRLVLNLLERDTHEIDRFSNAFTKLKAQIKFCKKCRNISDEQLCSICNSKSRDKSQICVVQDIRDILAIESTSQYFGVYHVLGGVISPMDGIGPNDLNISSLIERAEADTITEIIIALKGNMEGETTGFYLFRKLDPLNIKVTTIARGIAVGDDLEYADEISLGRSITNRSPYSDSMAK